MSRLAMAVLLLPASVVAGVAATVSGTFTMAVTQQQVVEVGDVPGHLLLTLDASGKNRSSGFMDEAAVHQMLQYDITQGNGRFDGYSIKWQGADSVIDRVQGKLVTILDSDGRPVTTSEGTWTTARGTGKYAGVAGGGSFKGRNTSPTAYIVDWQGDVRGAQVSER